MAYITNKVREGKAIKSLPSRESPHGFIRQSGSRGPTEDNKISSSMAATMPNGDPPSVMLWGMDENTQ
ncbi:hypothetical protein ACFLS1_11460 [Verrucomicrobiota bacterium]